MQLKDAYSRGKRITKSALTAAIFASPMFCEPDCSLRSQHKLETQPRVLLEYCQNANTRYNLISIQEEMGLKGNDQ